MNAVLRGVCAGLFLAAIEIACVIALDRQLFLSSQELLRYAGLALAVLPALGGVIAGIAAFGARSLVPAQGSARALHVLVVLTTAPMLVLALDALTSGRRVRGLPGRLLIVVALALGAAAVLAWLLGKLARAARAEQGSRIGLAVALLVASAAMLIDTIVLRRLYPAFHLLLAAAAIGAALAAAALVAPGRRLRGRERVAALALGVAWLAAGAQLTAVLQLPGRRFPIEQSAPLTGKLLAHWPALSRDTLASKQASSPNAPGEARSSVSAAAARTALPKAVGVDLRDRDVLLITIDALRADRLAAYGGHGLTPAIDALAREGRVFTRAYTPTPHTSYALGSLLTAKPLGVLYAVSDAQREQVTLPMLMRRHGYRTAAFYPPAIFFVDEDRFGPLAKEHFGFEYVKEMFAPAADRVSQLETYLAEAPRDKPLFVWTHLFEPHEPYAPPPRFRRGDTPVELYDGEVAAADWATGELVRIFREARPDATVIVSADHGEEHGEHGGHHHGTTLFDEQIRVPLVWSSPGVVTPGASDAPVELTDIATTLLSALGIPKDARMQGDDLVPLLADPSSAANAPRAAYASLPGLSMVTDGRWKALCEARTQRCQLFDLLHDPRERDDLSVREPTVLARLRADWDAFVAAVPRLEALDLSGEAWPESLTRGRLGDHAVAQDLAGLLSSPRAEIRGEAARLLGALDAQPARAVLARLLATDPEPHVRTQMAIAAFALGHDAARPALHAALADAAEPGLALAAALSLAGRGDSQGVRVLLHAAQASDQPEQERVAAIEALGALGPRAASVARELARLLSDVRLRVAVAQALGAIRARTTAPALAAALRNEPYPEARAAEARALLALGRTAEAVRAVKRYLGTESSVPGGVAILREAGALSRASGAGAVIADAQDVRRGAFVCDEHGCRPGSDAQLVLPRKNAPQGPVRVVLRVRADGTARALHVDGATHYVNEGHTELALARETTGSLTLAVAAGEGVWLEAVAVVPRVEEAPREASAAADADAQGNTPLR